jgi:hypothetical protein
MPALEPIISLSGRGNSRRGVNMVLAKVAIIVILLYAFLSHIPPMIHFAASMQNNHHDMGGF